MSIPDTIIINNHDDRIRHTEKYARMVALMKQNKTGWTKIQGAHDMRCVMRMGMGRFTVYCNVFGVFITTY